MLRFVFYKTAVQHWGKWIQGDNNGFGEVFISLFDGRYVGDLDQDSGSKNAKKWTYSRDICDVESLRLNCMVCYKEVREREDSIITLQVSGLSKWANYNVICPASWYLIFPYYCSYYTFAYFSCYAVRF